MEDINEKLTGSKTIYDCVDDSPIKQFFKMIDRVVSYIIVDNLYVITIVPISIYNIAKSTAISNTAVRGFSNFLFSALATTLLTNSEFVKYVYNAYMKSMFKPITILNGSSVSTLKD